MSNTFKKFMAALTSLFMALALVPATAFAAEATEGADGNFTYAVTPSQGSGSILINLPTDDANNAKTYKVYKVFDATQTGAATESGSSISYTVMSSKESTTLPSGFVTDSAGNVIFGTKAEDGTITPSTETSLTDAQIESIKTYLGLDEGGTPDSAVADVTVVADANSGKTLTISGLAYGYYYVTTTTGALVAINSTNTTANVGDKNSVTQVDDKKATSVTEDGSVSSDGHTAVAELGSTVTFEATVTFGSGAQNVKFHDQMSNGLSLNASSIKVTGVPSGSTYTVRAGTGQQAPDSGDTFTIDFSDGIAKNTKVTITYTATVTSGDLFKDPATNKAYTTYGDNNKSTEKKVDVYNAKVTVNKDFSGTLKENDYAGFVLSKTVTNADNTTSTKYYKYTVATNDAAAKVEWVDKVSDATELQFKEKGSQTFTGLDNGTYTLTESHVPDGFIKAADQTFTINGADSTTEANRTQKADITNTAGTALPTTGGMGTTLFTLVGAALVVTAGVALVTRRRMQQ